jgi:tetratricopeptide repeat protein 30
VQDYVNASDCYEQLTVLCPDQDQYKLYYAQSLYKCGLYEEALRVSNGIENAEYRGKVVNLQAAIKYAQDDIKSCINFLQKYSSDDPAVELNKACILFKVILYICFI